MWYVLLQDREEKTVSISVRGKLSKCEIVAENLRQLGPKYSVWIMPAPFDDKSHKLLKKWNSEVLYPCPQKT